MLRAGPTARNGLVRRRTSGVCATRRAIASRATAAAPPDYAAWDREYVLHPYTSMTDPLPTYPVRAARGVHIELEDGRRLVDGMSSWWAAVHGYAHPALDDAVRKQLDSMSHVMFGGLTHRPAAELGKLLADLAPGDLDKVFLCDSGSVAVEVAMKMAVQFWHTVGRPSKSKFVSLRNGYHGDTFGAMSVCDPVNGMHSMFSGVLAKQIFVDGPEAASDQAAIACASVVRAALAANSDDVAAVILEPVVQGAGGMRFHSPLLLRELRQACDEHGVLLIFDEIATGFGRTGALFACEHDSATYQPRSTSRQLDGGELRMSSSACQSPVVPDILCLGKALTGGYMTMGATLANRRVCEGISGTGGGFMHGPTFMGNPLSSATALASLTLLSQSPWQARVARTADLLWESLAPAAELDAVREVRVLGAIGVCELREPVRDMAAVQDAFVQRGVWLRPFGKLLYSMPPFNCPDLEDDDVRRIGSAVCEVAASLA